MFYSNVHENALTDSLMFQLLKNIGFTMFTVTYNRFFWLRTPKGRIKCTFQAE